MADTLGNDVGHYTFVSSLSVHDEDLPVGADEQTATFAPPFPDTEDVTDETYGPLKVACEVEAAQAALAHRARMNGLARDGGWSASMESSAA